jgi:conjugative transfer signal peptidase TraF
MTDRRRVAIGLFAVTSCGGLLATAASTPLPRLVWNASASAPLGLYRATPGAPIRVGDIVIARLPPAMRSLAAQRHYLPLGVPLVKRVVAVADDPICARGNTVTVNGKRLVRRLTNDRLGRALPRWAGCRTLGPGEIFLAMPSIRESFDGRYFGPTAQSDVIARAEPLWVR